jgi:hypothetical protein
MEQVDSAANSNGSPMEEQGHSATNVPFEEDDRKPAATGPKTRFTFGAPDAGSAGVAAVPGASATTASAPAPPPRFTFGAPGTTAVVPATPPITFGVPGAGDSVEVPRKEGTDEKGGMKKLAAPLAASSFGPSRTTVVTFGMNLDNALNRESLITRFLEHGDESSPPGEAECIRFRRIEAEVVDAQCTFNSTVVLMDNGEVYTCGSSSFGL